MFRDFDREETWLDKALEASLKALMYDATLSEAYASLALDLSPNDPIMSYYGACLYSRLEIKDKAVMLLRKAVEDGYVNFEWIKRDPDFENIRSDPGYINLMQDK